MADFVAVAVLDAVHQLFEIISCHWLTELSRNGQEIEKLTSFGQLDGDEEHILLGALLLIDVNVFTKVLEPDNVWVLQQGHRLDLVLDTINNLLRQVVLDNLDRDLLLLDSVECKLDFAREAVADGLDYLILSNFFWHFN